MYKFVFVPEFEGLTVSNHLTSQKPSEIKIKIVIFTGEETVGQIKKVTFPKSRC